MALLDRDEFVAAGSIRREQVVPYVHGVRSPRLQPGDAAERRALDRSGLPRPAGDQEGRAHEHGSRAANRPVSSERIQGGRCADCVLQPTRSSSSRPTLKRESSGFSTSGRFDDTMRDGINDRAGNVRVPKVGLEPTPPCEDRILSPGLLPSPSHWKQVAVVLKVCESKARTSPPWCFRIVAAWG